MKVENDKIDMEIIPNQYRVWATNGDVPQLFTLIFEASATSGDSSFCGVAKSVNSGQDLGSAQVGITNSSSVMRFGK